MTGPLSTTGAIPRRPHTAGLHVLHVVEALGSGIATALEDYVTSTPQHTHTVLAYRRPWAQTGDQLERLATRVLPLPEGRLAQIRTVRRRIRELRPDLVHAHSTYAGLYVRLFARPTGAAPVYTPHAYPFERRDVPAAVRGLYWLAEAGLSLGGGCVAAVGPRGRAGCPPTGPAGGRPAAERGARPAATASRCPRPDPAPRAGCGWPCWDGSHPRRDPSSSAGPSS